MHSLLPTRRDCVVGLVVGVLVWTVTEAGRSGFQWYLQPKAGLVWDDSGKAIEAKDAFEIEKELRSRIRLKNDVRRLETAEANLTIGEVARGRFGFVFSGYLKLYSSWLPFMPYHISKCAIEPRGSNFEIHIRKDGVVYIVGFSGSETARELRRPDFEPRRMVLYDRRWDEAPEILAVPHSRVQILRARSIDLGPFVGSAEALDSYVR